MSTVTRQRWWMICLGFLALILAHRIALIYRIQPTVSLWFPPSGVAIVLAIWLGPLGAALTGLVSIIMAPAWGSEGWFRLVGLTDASEPLVAWFLYRRCLKGSLTINTLRDAAAFTLSAPLMACITSAVVGSLTLTALGRMSEDLAQSIPHWWLGNAIGTMAIAPVTLLTLTPYLQRKGWLPTLEEPVSETWQSCSASFSFSGFAWLQIVFILAFSTGTAILTVAETTGTGFAFQQFSFLSFVPIVWAAARFGAIGGMMVSSFCVFITLLAYLLTYPNAIYLPQFPVAPEVLHVHKLSLLVQCAVSLLVGTAMTERAETQVALVVERIKNSEYQVRAHLSEQLMQLNRSLELTNADLQRSNQAKDEALQREQIARQKAEAAETTVTNILESINDAFVALDHDWRITYVNQETARMNAMKPEDMMGRNHWELWSWSVGTTVEQEYRRAIAEQVPVHFEVLSEPLMIWLDINAYPIAQGLAIYFRDITARKRVEEALQNALQRLNFHMENSPLAVIEWDREFRVIRWSPEAERMFGWTAEEAVGKHPGEWEFVFPEDQEDVKSVISLIAKGKSAKTVSHNRNYTKTGNVIDCEWYNSVLTNEAGEMVSVLSLVLNVTERKLLLQREQAAREEAEAANRIKDEFLAVLSHELRSPLNPILGWSRLLQSRKFDETTTTRALQTIERNAKLQTQLIGDLLDVSRILRGKFSLTVSQVNLQETIEAAIETVQLAAVAKSIDIATHFAADVEPVSGDANRLQQVVWNLLSNAIKFTPEGGRVEVWLTSEGSRSSKAHQACNPSTAIAQVAQIRVTDTGKGIKSDFLPHVFEYFRQADSSTTRTFGGLGLGLAIVRHIVELHGGTVFAASPGEGLGATFTVRLPCQPEVSQSDPAACDDPSQSLSPA